MSVCKHCSAVGGWHMELCPIRHVAKPYITITYPAALEVKPATVHEARTELSIACA